MLELKLQILLMVLYLEKHHWYNNKIEKYDGTSWSTPATLAVARNPSGKEQLDQHLCCFFSSGHPRQLVATEEYNKSANVITAAAWASGGNLNTGRNGAAGQELKLLLLAYGGQ